MPQSNQECTARRFPSFNTKNTPPRYDAGFECELPLGARLELVGESRDLSRSGQARRPIIWRSKSGLLVKGAAGLGLAVLLAAGLGPADLRKPARPAPDLVLEHSKAILAAPPTPGGRADGTAYGKAGVIGQRAPPRAVLLKLPPPRAELIRLPEWRIGEERPVMMPYNLVVLATYKGRLASQEMLPSSGNQLGDTWVVGETPWVWIFAPGALQADWIDP
jgi:hypothetical protein